MNYSDERKAREAARNRDIELAKELRAIYADENDLYGAYSTIFRLRRYCAESARQKKTLDVSATVCSLRENQRTYEVRVLDRRQITVKTVCRMESRFGMLRGTGPEVVVSVALDASAEVVRKAIMRVDARLREAASVATGKVYEQLQVYEDRFATLEKVVAGTHIEPKVDTGESGHVYWSSDPEGNGDGDEGEEAETYGHVFWRDNESVNMKLNQVPTDLANRILRVMEDWRVETEPAREARRVARAKARDEEAAANAKAEKSLAELSPAHLATMKAIDAAVVAADAEAKAKE